MTGKRKQNIKYFFRGAICLSPVLAILISSILWWHVWYIFWTAVAVVIVFICVCTFIQECWRWIWEDVKLEDEDEQG